MSTFKSLVDRARAKKDELEKQAARKAAEKAADMAFERGKQAAIAAVEQAGKSLRSAGASIEDALFGPDSEAPGEASDERDAAKGRGATKRDERESTKGGRGAAKRDEREATARAGTRDGARAPEPTEASYAEERERFDREVDEELLALKRKIARKP